MVHYGGFTVSFRVLSQNCMTGCKCVVLELAALGGEKNSNLVPPRGFFKNFCCIHPYPFYIGIPPAGLNFSSHNKPLLNYCHITQLS